MLFKELFKTWVSPEGGASFSRQSVELFYFSLIDRPTTKGVQSDTLLFYK